MAEYVGAIDQGTTSTRFMIFDHGGARRRDRPEGARADLSRSRAGSSTTRRRSGHAPQEVDRRRAEEGRHRPRRPRRRRHHQPARDGRRLGPQHRRAGLQRDRLAGHAHRQDLRRAVGGRRPGPLPREDRPAARHVLLRPEGPLDPRQRGRRREPGPRPATCCSATWTPGSSGTSPAAPTAACTSPTSPTPAARMLMDLATLDWDHELLDAIGVPRVDAARDQVVERGLRRGDARRRRRASRSRATWATSRRRSFGQTCFAVGEAKNTYGTGCFLLLNTGTEAVPSKNGLLTTVGYKIGDQPTVYALEGSIAITGALVQWLRDNLRLIKAAPEVEELAETVDDNGGVLLRAGVLGPVRAVLAQRRPRRHRRPDPLRQRRATSPARRSRRPRTRPARSSRR